MNTNLENKLRMILAEKNEKIIPENIKSGVTIFGVTGTCREFQPSDLYTELEYIQSTGTQYIDTSILANHIGYYEIEFMITEFSKWCRVLGTINYKNAFEIMMNGSINDTRFHINGSDSNSQSFNLPEMFNDFVNLRLTSTGNLIYNNTQLITNNTQCTVETNIYLCNGYENKKSKIKIKSFKAYNSNNDLYLNLIPVKRKADNVVCLYDTISNTFFENEGTGEFIAGGVV